MTRTGDHGGDSTDEINAALFVHSPVQIAGKKVHLGFANMIMIFIVW